MNKDELHQTATTLRGLAMDAVQKANSGHPGMPMGCAEIAAVLWGKIMKYNPADPAWPNRDRFVLSAGHGSMLLYGMLHLSGYDVSLDDLKKFRQLDSLTPGHPEFRHTPGVETTTGPLGQGFANGVGMGIARQMLASEFNAGKKIIDHYIYAIVGDGDLMEGVSYEAASIAGHMGLGSLIYIYDSNDISIEGDTNLAFSEDVKARFEACHWHVQMIDGHDFEQIEAAILEAQKVTDKPSLIIARTSIAKGSPGKEGSASSHGAPLGDDEVAASKKNIGLDPESCFNVDPAVYDAFEKRRAELQEVYSTWQKVFNAAVAGELKVTWDSYFSKPDAGSLRASLPAFETGESIATRGASGKVLEVLFEKLPNLLGGSADLGPSNKSFVKGYSESGRGTVGRNIHFGIREHAMGAIQNGIAYYGGFIPFGATFFVFMDYMRPAIRLAALSGLQTFYVFTHDSFFVGEDGPTHQPIEHLASARIIPNLNVIRPADAEETREAYIAALENTGGPTIICLTRQNVPVLDRGKGGGAEDLAKGAYIIRDCEGSPDIVLAASGSEVHVAMDAAEALAGDDIKARVISFPSWFLFDKQDEAYGESLFPHDVPVTVVEAGRSFGWEKYTGSDVLFITVEDFGASAPAGELAKKLGFTPENVVQKVKDFLK